MGSLYIMQVLRHDWRMNSLPSLLSEEANIYGFHELFLIQATN